MHKELRPEQIDILVGSSAVNNEFSTKVRELDRRLQMNGMQYREWDMLNDRQHEIFTDNLFLDGECASSPEHYVKGAIEACGCPATEEELHHHSPVLMGEIEKQEDMIPDIKVKIGESLNNLNEFIDLMVEQFGSLPHDSDEEFEDYLKNKAPDAYEAALELGASPDTLPHTPAEFYNYVHRKIFYDLSQSFPGIRVHTEGGPPKIAGGKSARGSEWRLTDTGLRSARDRALKGLVASLPSSILDDVKFTVEEKGKQGFTLQLEFEFTFPFMNTAGQLEEEMVVYKIELAQGGGAGGQAEGREHSALEGAIKEGIAANNDEPISIIFYDGPKGKADNVWSSRQLGEKRPSKEEEGYVQGRKGAPKTDIVLVDKEDNPVYYISHKDGNLPRHFNQWGGVSNILDHPEVKQFALAASKFLMEDRAQSKTDGDTYRHWDWVKDGDQLILEKSKPSTWPQGMVLVKKIEDKLLKLNAMFGEDAFSQSEDGIEAGPAGIDNVDATVQGPMKLEEAEQGVYRVSANHIFGPGQLENTSDEGIDTFISTHVGEQYSPIFLVRRAEGTRRVQGYDPAKDWNPDDAAVDVSTDAVPAMKIRAGRFAIFPLENRDVTHRMDDNYQVEAVLDKAYMGDGCDGWLCRPAALAAFGGTEVVSTQEEKNKETGKETEVATGVKPPQAPNSKGGYTYLARKGKKEVDKEVPAGSLLSGKDPWAKKFNGFKVSAPSVL
jgi:hypothetical protein